MYAWEGDEVDATADARKITQIWQQTKQEWIVPGTQSSLKRMNCLPHATRSEPLTDKF
jgi:hypothetical protein